MKLDLKELIAKMVKPSSCTAVTFPFTPNSNGILLVVLRANATGRTVQTYHNATPSIIDGYNIADGYLQGTLFVTKGQAVSVNQTVNIKSAIHYFIPLVGGVVRKLLKALKPLTLGRGWAK